VLSHRRGGSNALDLLGAAIDEDFASAQEVAGTRTQEDDRRALPTAADL
jgi:hypothetical protein